MDRRMINLESTDENANGLQRPNDWVVRSNGQFFHQFLHTCFKENGALQRMTEAAGETWTGPDSIDNYC